MIYLVFDLSVDIQCKKTKNISFVLLMIDLITETKLLTVLKALHTNLVYIAAFSLITCTL